MKALFSMSILALGMALAQPAFACDCDKHKEGKAGASCTQGKMADGKMADGKSCTGKDGKSCGCGEKMKEEKSTSKPAS